MKKCVDNLPKNFPKEGEEEEKSLGNQAGEEGEEGI